MHELADGAGVVVAEDLDALLDIRDADEGVAAEALRRRAAVRQAAQELAEAEVLECLERMMSEVRGAALVQALLMMVVVMEGGLQEARAVPVAVASRCHRKIIRLLPLLIFSAHSARRSCCTRGSRIFFFFLSFLIFFFFFCVLSNYTCVCMCLHSGDAG